MNPAFGNPYQQHNQTISRPRHHQYGGHSGYPNLYTPRQLRYAEIYGHPLVPASQQYVRRPPLYINPQVVNMGSAQAAANNQPHAVHQEAVETQPRFTTGIYESQVADELSQFRDEVRSLFGVDHSVDSYLGCGVRNDTSSYHAGRYGEDRLGLGLNSVQQRGPYDLFSGYSDLMPLPLETGDAFILSNGFIPAEQPSYQNVLDPTFSADFMDMTSEQQTASDQSPGDPEVTRETTFASENGNLTSRASSMEMSASSCISSQTSASRAAASPWNETLLEGRNGFPCIPFRAIQEIIFEDHNVYVPESTLRGRYRNLSKLPEHRVRCPRWTAKDIKLLREAVPRCSRSANGTQRPDWKKVAAYIVDHGGSYSFGNGTCSKKWQQLQRGQ